MKPRKPFLLGGIVLWVAIVIMLVLPHTTYAAADSIVIEFAALREGTVPQYTENFSNYTSRIYDGTDSTHASTIRGGPSHTTSPTTREAIATFTCRIQTGDSTEVSTETSTELEPLRHHCSHEVTTMPPTYGPYRRLPLQPPLLLPTPFRRTPSATLTLLAAVCLKLLADSAADSLGWVMLFPPTAPLPQQLRGLGLHTEAPDAWSLLESLDWVERHTTFFLSRIRLTPLGRLQAHQPPTPTRDATPWLAAVLYDLYPALSASPTRAARPEVPLAWSQVRTCFPQHWVIVQVTAGHTEGTFFLPDHFIVRSAHHHYADARFHFNALPPTPSLLLTHTSLARLVLDPPPRT